MIKYDQEMVLAPSPDRILGINMRYFLMTVLFAVILMSCASPVTSTVVPSSTPAPIQPTNTAIPTITLTLAPTPNPTQTPTVGKSIVVERKCMTLENEIPQDLKLPGAWLKNSAKPYLENLEDNIRYPVPMKGGGYLWRNEGWSAISPDGKLLAYLDGFINATGHGADKWEFHIIKSNGQFLPLKKWTFDTRRILGWAGNNDIVLEVYASGKKYLVYNPFTGDWKEIVIDRKVIVPDKWRDEIVKGGLTDYFNPDEIVFSTVAGYQLYNVQTWEKSIDVKLGEPPAGYAWSPDLSTFLAIPYVNEDGNDLYLLRNGKAFFRFNVFQLTKRETPLAFQSYGNFWGVKWAPDSKKFLVATYNLETIMYLDLLKATVLCVDSKALDTTWNYLSVWSPDSRFLIYYNYENHTNMLIDTEKWRAYKLVLKYDLDIIGWLASP
jgi:hypothetical protein